MNNVDFEFYRTHPRILEIRFILLFDMFEREFGYTTALRYYETICDFFRCDFTKIMGLVNKRFDIKKFQKSKLLRWRQEVIFTAVCYDESIYKVAKDYLILDKSTLYKNDLYKMEKYVTDEWLRDLDAEATLCGMKPYKIELERFFEAINNLTNVLIKWKGN